MEGLVLVLDWVLVRMGQVQFQVAVEQEEMLLELRRLHDCPSFVCRQLSWFGAMP